MTLDRIRLEISNSLKTSWATATEIAWPNHSFDPPAGPWIKPTIKMGGSYMGEMGDDGIGVRTGVLMVGVYDIPNNGEARVRGLAGRLENIFRRADLNGVHFEEPNSDTIGIDESNYYGIMVSIPFTTWIGE